MRPFIVLLLALSVASCHSKTVEFARNKPVPPPTMFQNYVDQKVTRDEMLTWLFSPDYKFKGKLVAIQNELRVMSLNGNQFERTRELDTSINMVIANFNKKSASARGYDLAKLLMAQTWDGQDVESHSAKDVDLNGAPAGSISDSASATLNSIRRNGVSMEAVDLFKYRDQQTQIQ